MPPDFITRLDSNVSPTGTGERVLSSVLRERGRERSVRHTHTDTHTLHIKENSEHHKGGEGGQHALPFLIDHGTRDTHKNRLALRWVDDSDDLSSIERFWSPYGQREIGVNGKKNKKNKKSGEPSDEGLLFYENSDAAMTFSQLLYEFYLCRSCLTKWCQ